MIRRQPELTPEEKAAGVVFRDEQQARLLASFETDPPTFTVLPWHKNYRHECSARNDVSTALELHEMYVLSSASGDIPAGRFGFIYKEGICRGCKSTARSRAGRIVDAYDRPPLEGRVAR